MADDAHDGLTDEQRREAAEGDLNVLAIIMVSGSAIFSLVNLLIGTLPWLAALATVSSTGATAYGLWNRNDIIAAVTKIGFGMVGLVAPAVGLGGLVLGLFGLIWGWAILAGSVLYFGFSVLGLEILERAEKTGVITPFSGL